MKSLKKTLSKHGPAFVTLGFSGLILAIACTTTQTEEEPPGQPNTPDASTTADPDGSTEVPDGSTQEPDGSTQEPDGSTEVPDGSVPEPTWTLRSHPCPGPNRTDALLDEPDGNIWIGCGSGATGYGLFHSQNDGSSWKKIELDEPSTLDQFRVLGIERGKDGGLYIAGINEGDGSNHRVLKLDTEATPVDISAVLVSVNQLGYSFVVGNFRQLADGSAIAESLNGVDALYRSGPEVGAAATSWRIVSTDITGGVDTQILDLVVHKNQFYATGGTINQPPHVFLPKADAEHPYELEAVALPRADGSWTGEMWGLAVNDQHLVVVGANQDDNRGQIYVADEARGETSDYREFNLSKLLGNEELRTWARGVCLKDDRIVVVGERQPLSQNTGLVFESTDGGQTFNNISPEDIGRSVSKCSFREDGSLVIVGSNNQIGFYR